MYSFISQSSLKDATFDSEFIRLCALYVVYGYGEHNNNYENP